MNRKFFKASDIDGANIEATIIFKALDHVKIENLNTGESVTLPPAIVLNLCKAIIEQYKKWGYENHYISGLKKTEVPDGYVLLLDEFFGLPSGTLLPYDEEWLYLPTSPYIISRKQFENDDWRFKYGKEKVDEELTDSE